MSDRACPFAFAVTTFSVKDLLLLCCLMIITSPPNLPSTERTMVNVYKILKIFIPCYFMVFVMKGILCLCLSFPWFRDSISKVTTFMEVPYSMNFSEAAPRRWLLQHAIPHFGTCRDWSAGWVSVSLTSIWKMQGLHSVISYKYPQLSGKFSIPQLIEQIFYASALYS